MSSQLVGRAFNRVFVAALIAGIAMTTSAAWGEPKTAPAKKKSSPAKAGKKESKSAMPALSFKMKDIDGKDQDLRQYYGKVVLMVNTASHCGFTPQYKGLEELYEKNKDKGLVILGFPANDFGKQEPGSDSEIKEFCTSKFNVTFPMFSKVTVKGDGTCDLYKYLTDKNAGHSFGGDVTWNFNKFLINRKGEVIGRFDRQVKPESDPVTQAVQKALAEPVPADAKKAGKKPSKPKKK